MNGCPSCKSSDVYPVPEGAAWFWACNDCGTCGPDDASRERALRKWHEMPLPTESEPAAHPRDAPPWPNAEKYEVKPDSPLLALLMQWRALGEGPLTPEEERKKREDKFPEPAHRWVPRNKETLAIWETSKGKRNKE